MSTQATISMAVTDAICVTLRSLAGKSSKTHVSFVMEQLGFDEHTAKRFLWFYDTLMATGALINEAIAAAWLANEAFGYDGVNSPVDPYKEALLDKKV